MPKKIIFITIIAFALGFLFPHFINFLLKPKEPLSNYMQILDTKNKDELITIDITKKILQEAQSTINTLNREIVRLKDEKKELETKLNDSEKRAQTIELTKLLPLQEKFNELLSAKRAQDEEYKKLVQESLLNKQEISKLLQKDTQNKELIDKLQKENLDLKNEIENFKTIYEKEIKPKLKVDIFKKQEIDKLKQKIEEELKNIN